MSKDSKGKDGGANSHDRRAVQIAAEKKAQPEIHPASLGGSIPDTDQTLEPGKKGARVPLREEAISAAPPPSGPVPAGQKIPKSSDIVLALVCMLLPQGWSMGGFPPNILGACICWALAIALLIHAAWIRIHGYTTAKFIGSILCSGIIVWLAWNPVINKYHKEHKVPDSQPSQPAAEDTRRTKGAAGGITGGPSSSDHTGRGGREATQPTQQRPPSPVPQPPISREPVQSGPNVPSPSPREDGLALSNEISTFLRDRQKNESQPGPPVYLTAPALDGRTPDYMKVTRALFVERFETRIVDVHDELSRVGLQDTRLEGLYRDIPAIYGNVDLAISDLANGIRALALLCPPKGMYKDTSDAQLAEMALDEAQKIEAMTNETMQHLAKTNRRSYNAEFRESCWNQVAYLRAEMLRRLGPSAFDYKEMDKFAGLQGIIKEDEGFQVELAAVLEYMHDFKAIAERLKTKAAKRP